MKKIWLVVSCLILAVTSINAQNIQYPFLNTELSFEERVNDLVNRMTLEEKVGQLMYKSHAIPRLGIPAYNWWSGATHGIGRTKEIVTVYPQSIALAATFNVPEMYITASQISDEVRAIHQKAKNEGRFGEQYYGLTIWDPNINIFRDPRWGRGHETYGEDPFLTAKIGTAFVKGLQGDDNKYLKTSACAKHFAVHSGPEASRSSFNSVTSTFDLWDTYLPAFKALISNGKVSSVMCAYNRLNGKPCCGYDLLMHNILRNKFGFTGYAVSDCGAIAWFTSGHKTHENPSLAAMDAILAGTDLECGDEETYATLIQSVWDGKIDESDLDESLKRVLMTKFRLGMFDPDSMVKYTSIPFSVVNSEEHKEQALKMARESIVMLKNENNTLPLSKNIRKIAIIGPNADNEITPLANYNGTPEKIITPLAGISDKLPSAKIIYDQISYPVVNREELNKIDIQSIVKKVKGADAIIFVGGLNAELEGENGDAGKIKYDGFNGGDRTTIMLPEIQTRIMKALHKTGKPVIFVMMTGSAIAIPWEAENIPAIINVWYGGQAVGTALADVLFGDYNPSGKLPVTFYKSDSDLPPYEDYSMENRTYRYFKGTPLYPFGFGLSYTDFTLSDLKYDKTSRTDLPVKVSVKITNNGKTDGSEVVQLYVSRTAEGYTTPISSLAGFEKVFLKAGESKTIEYTLTPSELCMVNKSGQRFVEPGAVSFTVINGQNRIKNDNNGKQTGVIKLEGEPFFVY